jgi:hypothetical protein
VRDQFREMPAFVPIWVATPLTNGLLCICSEQVPSIACAANRLISACTLSVNQFRLLNRRAANFLVCVWSFGRFRNSQRDWLAG